VRSLIAFPSIVTVDPALLLRAIEIYELDRIDFAEAYLVACAESSGVNRVASFDKAIDRVGAIAFNLRGSRSSRSLSKHTSPAALG
jgi:predicted nucleic-acid-binding protein